eukprot:CAMPEP_0173418606 /NCGR_PEP_ID=MMETSP1357-20121228/706_1 /TAXON_ID=77926 /ORGANISM="Hemiselmis rufescens, Strain PCC563" /LENGTH=132 /DNA_ID=CAMNT_0014381123 /DNA_START=110 /DNA_END=504 /DNA_ORIENTATION=+
MMSRRCLSRLPSVLSALAQPARRVSSVLPSSFGGGGAVVPAMRRSAFGCSKPLFEEAKEAEITPEQQKEIENSEEFASLTGNVPKKITDLGDQILLLNMIETHELNDYLRKKVGITDEMMMSAAGFSGGGGG